MVALELLFTDYDTDPLLLTSVKRNKRDMRQLRARISYRQRMRRERKLKQPKAASRGIEESLDHDR